MQAMLREEIREYLNPVYDLERLVSRISYRSANPRDLLAFKMSLEMIPHIKNLLANFTSPLLVRINEQMDGLEDLYTLLEASITEDPPLAVKEGGIIREGRYLSEFQNPGKILAGTAGSRRERKNRYPESEDQI